MRKATIKVHEGNPPSDKTTTGPFRLEPMA
jgi:hypothetical protein